MSEIQKRRILDLYRFLREATQLRFRPVRKLVDQPKALDLFSLPSHPSIQICRPAITADGIEIPEQLISVSRPAITRCPPPPGELKDWLVPGWEDPAKKAEYLESRNTVKAGQTITERFDDDRERQFLYHEWLQRRSQWAQPEILARSAMKVFEAFYELFAALEKEGELLELLVADGHLSWRVKSTLDGDVEIDHPVLLKRVELRFDPNKPEFTVHETDRDPELYGSLFVDLQDVKASAIKKRQDDLAAAAYHPLGHGETDAFLKAFVQTISPLKGVYGEECRSPDETPRVRRAPVLLLRKRVSGIANAIDAIIEDIEHRDVFPAALGQITGTAEGDWQSAGLAGEAGAAGARMGDAAEQILLAKEVNDEQLQIIKRLSRSGSVIVQGPPGTGKTHTIGNIIGHLLAQGKSVLVTSHTTKALRVLRDKVPDMLQPLCVSVLGSDNDARKQLEASVAAISERVTRGDATDLLARAESMAAERTRIMARIQTLGDRRRTALENEYAEIVVGDRSFSPADAARHVTQHRDAHSWIPSPVKLGTACTLSAEELVRVYALANLFSAADELDAALPLPDLDSLPAERQFGVMVDEYRDLTTADLSYGQEYWAGGSAGSEGILTLTQAIANEFSANYGQQTWRPYAIVAGIHGGTDREVWERVVKKIEETCEAGASHTLSLHHQPRLSDQFPVARQVQIITEIIAHIDNGGKLGLLQLTLRSEWRNFTKTAGVAAGSPSHRDHFEALLCLARLEGFRQELGALWDGVIGQVTGITFASLGVSAEQACRGLIPEMRRSLGWHSTVWLPLVEQLKMEGLKFDELAATLPHEVSPIAEYLLDQKLAVDILPPLLEKEAARRRLVECEQAFRALADLSSKADAEHPERGCIGRILAAVRTRDKEGYAAALTHAGRIISVASLVKDRTELIGKLGLVAPGWASHLSSRIPPHDAPTLPGDYGAAWTWRQLHDELAERDKLDVQEIQHRIDKDRLTLREITTELIDALAWGKQIKRLQENAEIRQALFGWIDTTRRLVSTRKADKRQVLLSAARNLMKLCAKAVPVWVMPISTMAESFDPRTTRFDVVIIDEASQADLHALIPLYMADQVVIVGDHEQVTPLGVGKDQTSLENLRKTMLQEIPNGHLYDSLSSIYDIGRQSFGDAICLAEHFRCVPEIIAYSNKLSYQGRIRPLRETNSSALKPACVPYRVDGVRQGKCNEAEAETIISLIAAMIKHPAYAGKTIGVISMVGDEQAVKIETLLHKRIESTELLSRRIQAGSSAQFQGDERDVMLLSFVDSQGDYNDGFIRAVGDGAFELTKKRFNVATSRARDQLWAIHSFDPDRHLKATDLRFELLQHMKNPWATVDAFGSQAAKADSDFERQVMKQLMDAGYRVKAQWQVGYYRIDLVVEGGGKRLAIECDGDRYHPLEKLEEDIARQTVLERLGWQFVRIRGSAFYRSPHEAMQPVFDRLEELGIPATGQQTEEKTDDRTLIYELEKLAECGSFSGDDPGDADVTNQKAETADTKTTVKPDEKYCDPESIVSILRVCGGHMPLENFKKAWANVRGYQRLGRNILESFDVELAAHVRKGNVVVSGDYISLS